MLDIYIYTIDSFRIEKIALYRAIYMYVRHIKHIYVRHKESVYDFHAHIYKTKLKISIFMRLRVSEIPEVGIISFAYI